ncbi:hypothetical protein JTB14_030291 [Gonioctena quinquepunctata]|nr:hypothetical protein JTB14_030291 [Gonioctena quinquepunctata]
MRYVKHVLFLLFGTLRKSKACGIYLLNSDKFTDDDFAPADNMNHSSLERDVSLASLPVDITTPQRTVPQSPRKRGSPRLSTSKESSPSHKTPPKEDCQNKRAPTSIAIISPVPVPNKKVKGKCSRQKQHSEILISTPLIERKKK